MESRQPKLEPIVDALYERSDARVHEILNKIADEAIKASQGLIYVQTENEEISQIPPVSI